MKLGIVVPYHKNQDFLFRMVQSIIDQDCDSWMVVVVDDSGGESPVLFPSPLIDNPKFDLIVNDVNEGLGNSWNIGVEFLLSKWKPDLIVIAHADDELEPRFVSESISIHERFPDVFAVHTGVSIIDESGVSKFSFPDFVKNCLRPRYKSGIIESFGDTGLAQLLRGDFIFCPTLSFKSSMIEQPTFDPAWKMVIDLNLLSRSLLQTKRIIGTQSKLYRYRRHGGNLTKQLNSSTVRFVEEIKLYQEVASLCEQIGYKKSSRVAQRMTIIRLHILFQMVVAVLSGKSQLVRKLLSVLRKSFKRSG
jgi:glycosyltransferase involved in cell wall biosynthesis